MQTILGAGGSIGGFLARELTGYDNHIRLVSRKQPQGQEGFEYVQADLLNAAQTRKALEGSKVAYLVAGLPYFTGVWEKQWPLVMKNVLDACILHNVRLVFFDNVYMYDRNSLSFMKEDSTINPSSRKGKVRAQLANMLIKEAEAGRIQALIARSADFYGPGARNSFLYEAVMMNLKKGKRPIWLGKPSLLHSFTYTPDAAKATALLGNAEKTWNQVWHLPTHHETLTGNQMVALYAREYKQSKKVMAMPSWAIKALGVFNPFMRELGEMMYQYESDYVFDSSRFMAGFPEFICTPYETGVAESVRSG